MATDGGAGTSPTGRPPPSEADDPDTRKRRQSEPGGGPPQKRREELELLQILKNNIDEGKHILKEHGLKLSRQRAPPGQDFARGRILCQKALRVQYKPEGGAPGKVEVVDLYVKNEAARTDRPNQANRPYIDQRFYLLQLPPGVTLMKRDTLHYVVHPAEPSSSAEGASLPLLIITDKPTQTPAGRDTRLQRAATSSLSNQAERIDLTANSPHPEQPEEPNDGGNSSATWSEGTAQEDGPPATRQRTGDDGPQSAATSSGRHVGATSSGHHQAWAPLAVRRKRQAKAKGWLMLSRKETRMPSVTSRTALVAYGKQLINPEATSVQDFPIQTRTRFEAAIRIQYHPDGKEPTPIQACDLYISIFQSSATNTGTLDIRFFLKGSDLPPGVHWDREYEFDFCHQLPNKPLLVIRDLLVPAAPPPPAPSAPRASTGRESTARNGSAVSPSAPGPSSRPPPATTGRQATGTGAPAGGASGGGSPGRGHLGAGGGAGQANAGASKETTALDLHQVPGPWTVNPVKGSLAGVLEGLLKALIVLDASDAMKWRFWCWAWNASELELVEWSERRCRAWRKVQKDPSYVEEIRTTFQKWDIEKLKVKYTYPPAASAAAPPSPPPAPAAAAQNPVTTSNDAAKAAYSRYIRQTVDALVELGLVSDDDEVEILDSLDLNPAITVEEMRRCVVEALHPAWERQDSMGMMWGLLVLVRGHRRDDKREAAV